MPRRAAVGARQPRRRAGGLWQQQLGDADPGHDAGLPDHPRSSGSTKAQPFTTSDVDAAAKVALLGKTVVDNLFNGEDPVGKVIRIKNVPFTVVGALVPKGPVAYRPGSGRRDPVPITTAKKKVIGVEPGERAPGRPDHGPGARRQTIASAWMR